MRMEVYVLTSKVHLVEMCYQMKYFVYVLETGKDHYVIFQTKYHPQRHQHNHPQRHQHNHLQHHQYHSTADSSIETGMEICENTGLNCENGSICVYQDGGSTFEVSCRCTDDWTGSSCETPKGKCGSTSVSCYNGGVCEETSDTATGYKCVCTKAFEGIHCEHEIDSQFSSSGPGSESSSSSDEPTENEETTENGVELPTSSVDSKGQASGVMTFLYVLLASLVCGTLFMAFKKRGERNTIDEKFDRNSELDLSYEVRDREVV